jgi:hypothetical protein
MAYLVEPMNIKIKVILVIVGLILGTVGLLNSFSDYAIQNERSLNILLYSLILIIVGTSRET